MTDYKKGVRFDCQDCGHDTKLMGELYMLLDDLWAKVCRIREPADMLCIGCVERRIDRKLNWVDFTDASLNWDPLRRRSLRMRDRLNDV